MSGKRVRVWQVIEPTYPKNKDLEKDIYERDHSRILVVESSMANIDEVLEDKLRYQVDQGLVLNIGRTDDDLPMVEFTSIEEATKALQVLMSDPDLKDTGFDFDQDYCADGYS